MQASTELSKMWLSPHCGILELLYFCTLEDIFYLDLLIQSKENKTLYLILHNEEFIVSLVQSLIVQSGDMGEQRMN